jgi:hypothetical protein
MEWGVAVAENVAIAENVRQLWAQHTRGPDAHLLVVILVLLLLRVRVVLLHIAQILQVCQERLG